MIKFRIHPRFTRRRGVHLGKCLKNVKIIGFFDIFLHILHKMKEHLGQERVKRGSQGKMEQFLLLSLEKWQFF